MRPGWTFLGKRSSELLVRGCDDMPLDSCELPDRTHPHRALQFSLRALLLTVLVVAIGFSCGAAGLVLAAAVAGTCYFLLKNEVAKAIGVTAGFLFLSCSGVGDSVQVRLDTGDQRRLFWGIPVSDRPMETESRRAIVSLEDLDVPQRWASCAPKVGSNSPDGMIYRYYNCAAAWVDVDPEIGKFVIRDIADYVQTTHGARGLPTFTSMTWPDVVSRQDDGMRVVEAWKDNPEVQAYLAAKGYSPR